MKRRRERGEGSLFQRADGLWVGRVELTPQIVDGKKKRRWERVYAKTKPEALVQLAKLKVKVSTRRGRTVRADRTTVAEYLTSWLDGHEGKPRTLEQYRWIVESYLSKRLGGIRLSALDLEALEAFFADLRKENVGARTRQLCYDILRAALKRAVRAKALPFNPLEEVARPRVDRREVDPWSAKEAGLVLEAAKTDRFAALYVLELRLGLQFPGEVLGLRWDRDVDLKARKLRVGGQLTEGVRGSTKTAARRRQLDLPQAVVDALVAHKERLLSEGLRSSPWVFPNCLGGAMNARNFVRDSFEKVVARAGSLACRSCGTALDAHLETCDGFVPGVRRVRPYDMRHTFATLALLGGVHIKVVSRMLGHANEVETLRTYSHFLPSMLEDANDRIGTMLGDDPPAVSAR